jgi:hypothetical protein
MVKRVKLSWVTVLSLLALLAIAQAEDVGEAVPAPPEIPASLIDGEVMEPEVTIIQKEESTIYEYRINGQLYMAKVQPLVGPAYYLVDRDGDGEFDSRSTDPESISVPQWILFRW